MLKIDYSLFIQIANFLVLLLLLNIILYRPIRRILKQRKDEMDGLELRASNLQARAAKDSKTLEESVSGARREGYKEKESLKAEALEAEKKMYQGATAEAGDKLNLSRREAEQKLAEIRQGLVQEVDLFSKELAEKILGRSL
ncbi:MAG: ATPase [Thermodesulfobacteriota bacterium]